MQNLILSHRDSDGITSAISYGVNYLYKLNNKYPTFNEIFDNFDIIDINYGENLYKHLEKINKRLDDYNQVVILDFSFDLVLFKQLYAKFKDNLIWIDHHQKTIENIENNIDFKINGLRDSNYAACSLVWKYFNKEIPEFVKLIEDGDLFSFKTKESKLFNYTLAKLNTDYNTENLEYTYNMLINKSFFEKEKKDKIKKGIVIQEFLDETISLIISKSGIIKNFLGFKTLIVNSSLRPSYFTDYINKHLKDKNIEILLSFYKTKKNNFKISLRSIDYDVDVQKIANYFNGGGHQKAAGFITKDLSKIYER